VTKKPIKILLVDEYTMTRQGIAHMLSKHPEVEVVAQTTLLEAVNTAKCLRPDVVIAELGMNPWTARQRLGRLLRIEFRPVVVVLTRFADEHLGPELLQMGAGTYVSKAAPFEELLPATFAALRGERLMVGVSRQSQAGDGGRPSARELEILLLVAWGMSNADIGAALSLSETTVKRHLTNLYRKMGVHSRMEAVNKALAEGWIAGGNIAREPWCVLYSPKCREGVFSEVDSARLREIRNMGMNLSPAVVIMTS
jgi:two-component system NarL family response regulator